MHEIEFIQDLAEIMLTSGLITVLFHRLKQPVVLGYIIAGILIGPYVSPFPLVKNPGIIRIFAELGVIFLMFSLGLEFSLRHLSKIGISALVASLIEIIGMIWIGYEIGIFFHWPPIDALFLGAMIAISSTTIIVKAINELNLQKENFVQLILGILVIEDILAIAILALLSSVATSDSIGTLDVAVTLGELILFLTASMIIGILIVPRLLSYVAKFNSHEMLLVTVLGLCFGFCLLVADLGYSIVLGAFLIGAIVAESKELDTIRKLIDPLRDMFSAMFFVAIGLMFNPKLLVFYWLPILVITLAVIIGKVLACSFGTFITGQDGRTSLRVGMGLAQIGEFSFIIAALGTSLKITGDFLYPIAVSVSIITTMTTPYLIKAANPFANVIEKIFPTRLTEIFSLYTAWLQGIQKEDTALQRIVRRNILRIFLNLLLVLIIFLGSSRLIYANLFLKWEMADEVLFKTILWCSALLISLPFLIAIYRKIKLLSMLLAEASTNENLLGRLTIPVKKIIAEIIPAASMLVIMLFISALSASILPPKELLIIVLVIATALIASLWRLFIKIHIRLKTLLVESMAKDTKEEHK